MCLQPRHFNIIENRHAGQQLHHHTECPFVSYWVSHVWVRFRLATNAGSSQQTFYSCGSIYGKVFMNKIAFPSKTKTIVVVRIGRRHLLVLTSLRKGHLPSKGTSMLGEGEECWVLSSCTLPREAAAFRGMVGQFQSWGSWLSLAPPLKLSHATWPKCFRTGRRDFRVHSTWAERKLRITWCGTWTTKGLEEVRWC